MFWFAVYSMIGFMVSMSSVALASHSFQNSTIQFPVPPVLRVNYTQVLGSEIHDREYHDSRPANRPVCGRPRSQDRHMIVQPSIVYRDGWAMENRWTILTLGYGGAACFSGGRQVRCWEDIPWGERPRNTYGFQSWSDFHCSVRMTTRPSINDACRYPVSPGEVELRIDHLRQSIATSERSGDRQIAVSFSQSNLGREQRLHVSLYCIRPVNDTRPVGLEDVLQALGPAFVVR